MSNKQSQITDTGNGGNGNQMDHGSPNGKNNEQEETKDDESADGPGSSNKAVVLSTSKIGAGKNCNTAGKKPPNTDSSQKRKRGKITSPPASPVYGKNKNRKDPKNIGYPSGIMNSESIGKRSKFNNSTYVKNA